MLHAYKVRKYCLSEQNRLCCPLDDPLLSVTRPLTENFTQGRKTTDAFMCSSSKAA